MAAPMRIFLLAAGLLLTAVGIAGVFIPLLPTTIFLILALACFARSSAKMEKLLLENRRFGPALRAWREEGSIRLKHKAAAIGVVWTSAAATATLTRLELVPSLAVVVVSACLTLYISTRPTRRPIEQCPLRPKTPEREFGN